MTYRRVSIICKRGIALLFVPSWALLIFSITTSAVAQTADDQLSPPASGNPLPAREDEWRFTVAFPMAWTPDIDGEIRGDAGVSFHVPFDDILDNLNSGMMFELYANRGPYGLALRTDYMRVEDENSRSGLISTRVATGLDMSISDLLASFRVHDKVRLLTGIRQVTAKLELDVFSQIGPIEIINERITVADQSELDILMGINLNHWFDERWGVMLNVDSRIAGDSDSDWNVEIRGLYRLGALNNFWFGYRYLRIGNDFSSDNNFYSLQMSESGPMLGWAFTF